MGAGGGVCGGGRGEALVEVLDGLLARDSLLQAAEIDKASGHGMSGRVQALRALCDRLHARVHRLLDVALRDFLINMRSQSGSFANFCTNIQHVWQTWTVKDAREFARVILDNAPSVIWVLEMRLSAETALLSASEFLPHDLGPLSHPEFKRAGVWTWPPLTPVVLEPYRFFERLARIVARNFYHHTMSATYRDSPWDMDRVQTLVATGLDDAMDEFVPLPVPSERAMIDAAAAQTKAQQQTHAELAKMFEHRVPWLTAYDGAIKAREGVARDADEWFKKQRVAGSRVSDYCLRAEQAQANRDLVRQQALSKALAEAAPLVADRIAEKAPASIAPVLSQLSAICEANRHATQVLQHLHTAVHNLSQQHAQLAAQLAARPIPAAPTTTNSVSHKPSAAAGGSGPAQPPTASGPTHASAGQAQAAVPGPTQAAAAASDPAQSSLGGTRSVVGGVDAGRPIVAEKPASAPPATAPSASTAARTTGATLTPVRSAASPSPNPYAAAFANPSSYSIPPEAPPNPYAMQERGANPYPTQERGANPYATQERGANPYAMANPYASQDRSANPHASQDRNANPYASQDKSGHRAVDSSQGHRQQHAQTVARDFRDEAGTRPGYDAYARPPREDESSGRGRPREDDAGRTAGRNEEIGRSGRTARDEDGGRRRDEASGRSGRTTTKDDDYDGPRPDRNPAPPQTQHRPQTQTQQRSASGGGVADIGDRHPGRPGVQKTQSQVRAYIQELRDVHPPFPSNAPPVRN